MPDLPKAFIPPTLGDEEAAIIRRLGWAVILQWDHLAGDVQKRIQEQAIYTEDGKMTVQKSEQIDLFIEAHKRDNDASRS